MDVTPKLGEIPSLLHQERFETPLKDMPAPIVSPIEIHRMPAQQPLHPSREICLTGERQQVKMISHQHPRMQLDDGWNLIAEYNASNSHALDRTYLWGLDLSGNLQGAGGVGGLLAVDNGAVSHHPTYDGNGNVSEYLNALGTIDAHYEYDAFGKTIVASGTSPASFSHRFSTKPEDKESGFYYYGYRFYAPDTGRWLSRDPIGEQGGENLYSFVRGNPISFIDDLGRITVPIPNNPLDRIRDLINNVRDLASLPERVLNDLVDEILAPLRRLEYMRDELERIRDEGHAKFGNSSCARHCYGSCEAKRAFGEDIGRLAGAVNEIQGFIRWDIGRLRSRIMGQSQWAFQAEDFVNNELGFIVADSDQPCDVGCACACASRGEN